MTCGYLGIFGVSPDPLILSDSGIPTEASGPSASPQLSGAWPPKAKAYLGPTLAQRSDVKRFRAGLGSYMVLHPLQIFTICTDWIHERIQYPVPTQMSTYIYIYIHHILQDCTLVSLVDITKNWTASIGANWTDPLNFILPWRHCKTSNCPLTPAQLQQTYM